METWRLGHCHISWGTMKKYLPFFKQLFNVIKVVVAAVVVVSLIVAACYVVRC